jgi:hypothetical protein
MEIFQLDNLLAELQMLIHTFVSSPESSWLSVAFVHFLSNFVFTPLIVSCGHLFSIFPQLNRSHNAMCFPLAFVLLSLCFLSHTFPLNEPLSNLNSASTGMWNVL